MRSLIESLRDRARKWWTDHILANHPPPLSGDAPDSRWVNSQYPVDSGLIIYACAEIDDLCVRLHEAKATVKEAEREESRLANLIKSAMGDAAVLETSIGRITWKTNANSRRFRANLRGGQESGVRS